MDIDEAKIGAWPNIAIDPRTGRHAATGEEVERGGQMSDNELLPCPFCGSDAEIVTYDRWREGSPVGVGCSSCPTILAEFSDYRWFATEDEAIAAWNARAPIEYDDWFYLPKPKERLVVYGETKVEESDDGCYRMRQSVDVVENAINSWANELGEYVMQRICEAWNARAVETCENVDDHKTIWFICSKCGRLRLLEDMGNYCDGCGRKVVES